MKNPNKKIGYTIGIIALCVILSISGYISLVVVGVVADENINGNKNVTQSANDDFDLDFGFSDDYEDDYINDELGDYSDSVDSGEETTPGNNPVVNNNDNVTNNNVDNNGNTQNGDKTGTQTQTVKNKYLDTNKSAADVVKIYATVMNKAKKDKPGFTKIEYQELPSDAENRVISEGAEKVTGEWIDKLFGFVEKLGIYVPKEKALDNQYVHSKGDSDMSLFPVFNRSKGSYLTDPKAIRNYSYRILSNGNVRMKFVLINENNPEPIGENTNVAPSYTGAVFSPMSKEQIDGTLNNPIVSVFATDIKYTLKYHDCSVEVEFNPKTLQLVKVVHLANVSIKGSGNVRSVGLVGVERQELLSTVIIKDFKW